VSANYIVMHQLILPKIAPIKIYSRLKLGRIYLVYYLYSRYDCIPSFYDDEPQLQSY
jgi:hypothetical protein